MIEPSLSALPAAIVFGGIVMMQDRKRGALLAQLALVVAVAMIFAAIVLPEGAGGGGGSVLGRLGTVLVPACVAAMLYHLYLGRFTRVWAARGVFAAVFLGFSALFSLVILSLI